MTLANFDFNQLSEDVARGGLLQALSNVLKRQALRLGLSALGIRGPLAGIIARQLFAQSTRPAARRAMRARQPDAQSEPPTVTELLSSVVRANRSPIETFWYDPENGWLYIAWPNGLYQYYSVPQAVFDALRTTGDRGRVHYFNRRIRNTYSYTRLY